MSSIDQKSWWHCPLPFFDLGRSSACLLSPINRPHQYLFWPNSIATVLFSFLQLGFSLLIIYIYFLFMIVFVICIYICSYCSYFCSVFVFYRGSLLTAMSWWALCSHCIGRATNQKPTIKYFLSEKIFAYYYAGNL